MHQKIIASLVLSAVIFTTGDCSNIDDSFQKSSAAPVQPTVPLTSDPMPKYYFSEPLLFNFSTHEEDLFNFDDGDAFTLRFAPDYLSGGLIKFIDEQQNIIFEGADTTKFLICPDTEYYQNLIMANYPYTQDKTKLLVPFNSLMTVHYRDKNEQTHKLKFIFSWPVEDLN